MATKNKKIPDAPKDLLTRLDEYFEKNRKFFFWFGMCSAFIFSLLLFTVKMSEMGDDSGYVQRAFNLIHNGSYPSFYGPFYPMVLSVFVAVFGVKIVLLKFLSMVFVLLSLYFFWKSFSDKIPYALLVPVFILIGINSYILFFSSQTFSEALYMLMESLLFLVFTRFFVVKETDFSLKKEWRQMLLLGLILFLGSLTRNVHYGALAAIIVVFLIWKRWKSAMGVTVSFGIFYSIFEIIKRLFWGFDQVQFSSQGQQMLYKDPYNAAAGTEDFGGFVTRFIENSQTYISKFLYSMVGLRPEDAGTSGILTILTYILLVGALILVFKKNKTIQLVIFYISALCSVSFIGLQSFWSQWRLIAVFLPYILIALLSFFYYGLKKYRKFQFVYPLILICLFIGIFSDTVSKTSKNIPVLKKNIAGDMFADYTPDWKNFMLMSQWAAKNTPEKYMTASRKPEMSFIYSGRAFYGVYSVKEVSFDELKAKVENRKILFGADVQAMMQLPINQTICKYIIGIVQAEDNTTTALYQLESSQAVNAISEIRKAGISPDLTPLQTIDNKIGKGMRTSCVDPDLLVRMLKENRARYMILPSLRMNPAANTGEILTTMHRYLMWIQVKYPRSIRLVNSIGNSEPAQLVEFDLENMN